MGAVRLELGLVYQPFPNAYAALSLCAGFLSFDKKQDVDTLTYDTEVSLHWFPMLLDYNPGGSLFRNTGGFLINGSSIDATCEPEVTVELGGHTYTPEDVGIVVGEVDMPVKSTYLGAGLGRYAGGSPGIRATLDAGVAFTSFYASLGHEGGNLPAELEGQLAEDLALEADSLNKELEDLNIYPVLSVGITYPW